MKIAFYANEIAKEGGFGVKTYSLEIIKSLLEIDKDNEYVLYSDKDIAGKILSERVRYEVRKPKRFWAFSVFAKEVCSDKPDVIFMPIQTFPFFGRNHPKTVVTVHDLAFLLFPRHFTFFRRKMLEFHTRRAVRLSDKIIVPSEATKRDIIHFYGVKENKIVVVYHGFSQNLLETKKNRDESVLKITGHNPYVLFVGSIQPRKNIVSLVRAFEIMKQNGDNADLKLVLCGGKGWLYEDIYKEIAESPCSKDILFTGSVKGDLLAAFYRNALFFVMPSLYEGFGLPVLEAMSFGLPVICSNNSSLGEVAGDAALLIDPYRISDIGEKMGILAADKELRVQLSAKSLERAKDLSWKKAARETLKVLGNL